MQTSEAAPRRDYERVERAIAYLETNFREQPDLGELAGHIGLSEFHLQRLFTRWAGVTPKQFLQHLTLDAARESLARSPTVFDAALDAGLSGPGRLHELFVTHEAVTPGEYKSRGAGITIRYGYHESPFGECLLLVTERGVCGLGFVANGDRKAAFDSMARGREAADMLDAPAATAPWAERIFATAAGEPAPLRLLLRGTPFQLKVWEALLTIPAGCTVSYGQVARRVGHAGGPAMRAVGSAIGANALAYLIPCHRVIRKSGNVGEYRWGSARKRAMLGWEASRGSGSDAPADAG